MDEIRVSAAQGATLRAPVKLRLTKEQHALRAHLLGPVNKKGIYSLDTGELTFKCGEVFGLEGAEGRLNLTLFDLINPEPAPVKPAPEGDAA